MTCDGSRVQTGLTCLWEGGDRSRCLAPPYFPVLPFYSRHAPAIHQPQRSLTDQDRAYMDLDDQHPQGGVPFEPLSIPIFAPSFPSSTSPLAVSLGHLPDPDLLQFDYDEQIPEYSKESGSESSGEFVTSQGFGAGQTSSLGDYEELAAQYDGLVFPRRSIRERRLPPQLLAAVPLELRA